MLLSKFAALALPVFALGSVHAQDLALETVAEGLTQPNGVYTAPGDTSRLFVMSGVGTITIIENGVVLPDPFFDIQPILFPGRGLTSMAFHPDYFTNGRFFVVYQAGDMTSQVVEYQVSADPNIADPASAQTILGPVVQTTTQHAWDQLLFAPDGMLILGNGDGTDPGAPGNVAQDLGVLAGKIIRLDVDAPAPYIPADNPFVGISGAREEIWHYGVRQPWRMSFDAGTGDLFVADVGFDSTEEVNILPAGGPGGRNLGWRCFEGSVCENLAGCTPTCGDVDWVLPAFEYPHTDGRCAVIGGFVYRGSTIPSFEGRYLFADYCAGLYSMRYENGVLSDYIDHTADLLTPQGNGIPAVSSFGQDEDGELYIVSLTGAIYRLVAAETVTSYCETSPNSVGTGALMGHVGSTSIGASEFTITASGAIPDQFGLFFYGPEQAMQAEGDGILCVGGGLLRILPAVEADPFGGHRRMVDFTSGGNPAGAITAGSTWHFQLWYRDPNGPGGNGYNFSDALQALFLP